jgi:hypothetical protein
VTLSGLNALLSISGRVRYFLYSVFFGWAVRSTHLFSGYRELNGCGVKQSTHYPLVSW